MDEYYNGVLVDNKGLYQNKVKDIISTSIEELLKYDYRTWVMAEIKFFQMWWLEQTEEKKEQVRKLVKDG